MKGDALERYVQSATRGLYGERRARVVRELRGNLEGRINEFLAFGDSRERAMEKALLEFGAAGEVARGLREVHVMPILNRWTAVFGLLGIAAFMSLSANASTVRFTLESPAPPCAITPEGKLNAEPCTAIGESWLELNSLVETFEANKVKARVEVRAGKSLSAGGSKPTQLVSLVLTGQPPIVLETLKGSGQEFEGGPLNEFSQDGKRYLSTQAFIAALGKAQVPLKVSGFINPTLELTGVSFSLGNVAQPVNIQAGLERMISNLVFAQYNVGSGRTNKPLEVSKLSPLDGFDAVMLSSDIRYFADIAQYPQKRLLPNVPGKFFLLLTKTSNSCCTKTMKLLNIELLERQPDNTLETLSLPVNPEFVRSNKELREGPSNAVWLLPVNFEKPLDVLDLKQPVSLNLH